MSKNQDQEIKELKKVVKEKDELLAEGKTLLKEEKERSFELEEKLSFFETSDPAAQDNGVELGELQIRIVNEAKKIAKNEVGSCYDLVVEAKKLIEIESAV